MSQLLEYIPETEKEYYRKYLSQYQPGRYFAKFNWPAFIFGHLWMFYRRMYSMGINFALAGYCNDKLIEKFVNKDYENYVASGAFLVLHLLMGFYGTAMYAEFLDKRIKKGKSYPSTNWWNTGLVVILYTVGIVILSYYDEI
jgi:hypothetical protein